MRMAYSLDYRRLVMKIKSEENLTFKETSERFKVGMRTLFRWNQRIEPCKTRNKPATKIDMEALKEDVKKNPDAYLFERGERLGASASGIFYALKRLGISYKKNSVSSKSGRGGTRAIPGEDKGI